jgi:hypothetical protein
MMLHRRGFSLSFICLWKKRKRSLIKKKKQGGQNGHLSCEIDLSRISTGIVTTNYNGKRQTANGKRLQTANGKRL